MIPGFLVAQALASLAVLSIAASACLAMRRKPAAHRHFVWLLAFASLLVVPVASWYVVPLFPHARQPAAAPRVTVLVTPPSVPTPVPSQPRPAVPVAWPVMAAALWAAGTTFLLARGIAGMLICAQQRRRAAPAGQATRLAHSISANMRLRRRPAVLLSEEVSVPETFGFRAPVILLPRAARDWPQDRLRLVLLHELFHIQRHDWAVHLLAHASAALFWFNPLCRYGLSRMCDEREKACDDDVLRCGVAGSEYARELVRIADASRTAPAFGVAMGRSGHLEGRIRAILNPQVSRRRLTVRSRILTIISAALVAATASLITAPAQTGTAVVRGIINDASGARVPGAQVTLAKGTALETVRAGQDGAFEFSGIPDGTYALNVAAPGFKRLQIPDVVANAAAPAFLNLTVTIGSIAEHLTVTAQGVPHQQPAIASTVLEQPAQSAPPTTSFASVVAQPPPPAAGRTRIRVGGNVKPARLLAQRHPEYPQQMIAQGVEGTVILEAVIGTDGRVLSVTPKNSQVQPDLIQAATDALKGWRYEPTLLNGQPVEVVTTVTYDFRLKP